MERAKPGAHARATFDEARVGSPIARRGRRVGPLSVLAAVGHELAAVGATVRRTTEVTWLGFALLMGAAATFALPIYLLAQATLFWRVMRQFPGVLAGA